MNDSQSCKNEITLRLHNNMYVEILAYLSSDWRSISHKEAIVQAHAQ